MNNKLSNVEAKIQQLEKEIKTIDVELQANYDTIVSDPKFFEKYQAKKDKLEKLMIDWEVTHEELEKLS